MSISEQSSVKKRVAFGEASPKESDPPEPTSVAHVEIPQARVATDEAGSPRSDKKKRDRAATVMKKADPMVTEPAGKGGKDKEKREEDMTLLLQQKEKAEQELRDSEIKLKEKDAELVDARKERDQYNETVKRMKQAEQKVTSLSQELHNYAHVCEAHGIKVESFTLMPKRPKEVSQPNNPTEGRVTLLDTELTEEADKEYNIFREKFQQLTEDKHDLEQEIERLKSTIEFNKEHEAKLKEMLVEAQTSFTVQEQLISLLREQNQSQALAMEKLELDEQRKSEELRARLGHESSKFDSKQKEFDAMKRQYEEREKLKEQMKTSAEDRAGKLMAALQKSEDEKTALGHKLDETTADMERGNVKIGILQERVTNYERLVEEMKRDFDIQHSQTKAQMSSEVDQLKQVIAQLNSTLERESKSWNEKSQFELVAAKEELRRTQNLLMERDTQIKQLETDANIQLQQINQYASDAEFHKEMILKLKQASSESESERRRAFELKIADLEKRVLDEEKSRVDLQQELQETRKQLIEHQTACVNAGLSLEANNNEVVQWKDRVAELERALKEGEKERERVAGEMWGVASKLAQTESQLSREVLTVQSKRNEIAELKETIEHQGATIAALEGEMATLTKKAQDRTKALDDQLCGAQCESVEKEGKLQQLETEIKGYQRQIGVLNAEIERQKDVLKQVKAANADAESRLKENCEARVAGLEQQLKVDGSNIDELHRSLREAKHEVAELVAQLAKEKINSESKDTDLLKASLESERLRSNIATLNSTLEEQAQFWNQKNQSQSQVNVSELSLLQDELMQKDSRLKKADSEISALQQQVRKLGEELDFVKDNLNKGKAMNSETEMQLRRAHEEKVSELEKRLQLEESDKFETAQKLREARNSVTTLETELSKVRVSVKAQESELVQWKGEADRFRNQVTSLNAEMEEQAKWWNERCQSQTEELANQNTKLHNDIMFKENLLKKTETDLSIHQQQVAKLMSEVEFAKELLSKTKNSTSESENNLRKIYEDRITDMERKLQNEEKARSIIHQELRDSRKELTDSQTQILRERLNLEAKENELVQTQFEANRLRQSVAKLNESLEEQSKWLREKNQSKITEMEAELQAAQTDLIERTSQLKRCESEALVHEQQIAKLASDLEFQKDLLAKVHQSNSESEQNHRRAFEDRAAELQVKLQEEERRCTTIQHELRETRKELTEAQTGLVQEKVLSETKENELIQQRYEVQRLKTALSKLTESTDEQTKWWNEKYEDSMRELQTKVLSEERNKETLGQELRDARTELAELRSILGQERLNGEYKESDVAKLRTELEAAHVRIAQLEAEVKRLEQVVQSKSELGEQIERELEDARNVREQQAELHAERERHLQKEISKLHSELLGMLQEKIEAESATEVWKDLYEELSRRMKSWVARNFAEPVALITASPPVSVPETPHFTKEVTEVSTTPPPILPLLPYPPLPAYSYPLRLPSPLHISPLRDHSPLRAGPAPPPPYWYSPPEAARVRQFSPPRIPTSGLPNRYFYPVT